MPNVALGVLPSAETAKSKKGVTAVAMDIFPEKPVWRIPLDTGEVWVANQLAILGKGITLIQFVTNLSHIG